MINPDQSSLKMHQESALYTIFWYMIYYKLKWTSKVKIWGLNPKTQPKHMFYNHFCQKNRKNSKKRPLHGKMIDGWCGL